MNGLVYDCEVPNFCRGVLLTRARRARCCFFRGQNADQYRISEAYEAGAIPLVREGHAALAYLEALGLRHLTVPGFLDAPALLARVDSDARLRLQLAEWQPHNNVRWDGIKARAGTQLAYDICRAG